MTTMVVGGKQIVATAAATTDVPSTKYSEWLAPITSDERAVLYATGSGDDGATYRYIPRLFEGGNKWMVVSWEGGLEFGADADNAGGAAFAMTIPGVNRYYSINTGNRMALIVHATGRDSGLTSIEGAYIADEVAVMRAVFNRGGENTIVTAKILPANMAEIYVEAAGAALSVICVNINESNVIVGAPVTLTNLTAGQKTKVLLTTIVGYVTGVVYDQSGNPCERSVRIYNRDTGLMLGSAMSDSVTGAFTVSIKSGALGDELYAVALDDDAPPDINAVIADRIILS